MLSSVQTTLSVKEGKYLSSNNSFYDLTDHRGQGNRTIIIWDSFIARLVNRNNSSSLPVIICYLGAHCLGSSS